MINFLIEKIQGIHEDYFWTSLLKLFIQPQCVNLSLILTICTHPMKFYNKSLINEAHNFQVHSIPSFFSQIPSHDNHEVKLRSRRMKDKKCQFIISTLLELPIRIYLNETRSKNYFQILSSTLSRNKWLSAALKRCCWMVRCLSANSNLLNRRGIFTQQISSCLTWWMPFVET